ncbi:MAG: hypothetical protein MZV64_28905 [Ignavibacteriales bacterium]|nr:hypothetical protein [Ignavibacteriales bacterium]
MQPAAGDAGGALGARPARLAPAPGATSARPTAGRTRSSGSLPRARSSATTRSRRFLDDARHRVHAKLRRGEALLDAVAAADRRGEGRSAGSRGAWSSARARSAAAASSATPARRRCSR